jgi:hypothetical protein
VRENFGNTIIRPPHPTDRIVFNAICHCKRMRQIPPGSTNRRDGQIASTRHIVSLTFVPHLHYQPNPVLRPVPAATPLPQTDTSSTSSPAQLSITSAPSQRNWRKNVELQDHERKKHAKMLELSAAPKPAPFILTRAEWGKGNLLCCRRHQRTQRQSMKHDRTGANHRFAFPPSSSI